MFDWLLASQTVPSVYFNLPPSSFFKFPPPEEPQVLPPPVSDSSLARPFNISPDVYNNALHVSVPITIALVYSTTATYLNRINRQRNNKPWSFSKTRLFYFLVLLHNVFLAAYSAWTLFGMTNAIIHTWPGWEGEHRAAQAADALCKMHGPRGYGSAATHAESSGTWGFTDTIMQLDQGLPDSTDVGRLWNEGLAFYGWLFYISKFYELIDTLIVLAKGKNTSFLQTYHHAGVMFCLWSGIRYMSPPIWMFVIVNSFIHTLMYTYYSLKHLAIQVPGGVKRTITSLQIVQIVWGITYSVAHLFLSYDIPVQVSYVFVHNLSSALPAAVSSISSVVPAATISASVGSWLKKAALRAAGEEGLAENVRNSAGETFGIDAIHAAEAEKAQEEIRHKLEYQRINCLDTSGQAFAIWLNFVYLAPLAVMFIRFYARSYLKKARSSSPPQVAKNVWESGKTSVKDVGQEVSEAMSSELGDRDPEPDGVPSGITYHTYRFNEGSESFVEKVEEVINHTSEIVQEKVQDATDVMSEKVNEMNKRMKGPKEDTAEAKEVQIDSLESEASSSDEALKNGIDDPPKLRPYSFSGFKRSQSRSVSPQKRTQLPRPSKSHSRKASPEKKNSSSKEEKQKDLAPTGEEEKPKLNGEGGGTDHEPDADGAQDSSKKDEPEAEDKPSSLDESAYEVNPDELENDEEKKADAEFQPKLVDDS